MYHVTCKHVTTINEKMGHEFGREEGQVCGKVWKEERKEQNYIVTL